MKDGKFCLFAVCLVLVTFVSCVSLTDKVIPRSEVETTTIIGKVQTTFTSWQPLYIIGKKNIQAKAYSRLLEQAKYDYGENVDVRNIKINGSFSGYNLWVTPLATLVPFLIGGFSAGTFVAIPAGTVGLVVTGDFQKITAIGDVISLKNSPGQTRVNKSNATGIEGAVSRASRDLIIDLPENSKIAVISVSSNNRDVSALVVDELEFHLVSARKFTIVDRRTLDAIRTEQKFQMSGEVSDASAVSIGQMLGANIVITGSVTGTGTNQRLSIKALNVQTAQIVTMVRETF